MARAESVTVDALDGKVLGEVGVESLSLAGWKDETIASVSNDAIVEAKGLQDLPQSKNFQKD